MSKMLFIILLALVMMSTNAVASDEPWHGVWSGTVGGQQVMVCLDDPDDSSYYYLRHSNGISLFAKDKTGARWTEMSKGKKTGEWKLETISQNRISGNWFAPKGKRSMPVVLQRIAAPSGGDMCDSEAYNGPRIESTKIDAGKPESFEGKRFRTLSALDVSTIELLEDGLNIKQVNQALREKLRKEITFYFQCHASVNNRTENLSEYSATETPVFWNSRWLTLAESSENYCGGAHSNHGYYYQTWDLEQGKPVDLWKWFNSSENEASDSLNKVIIAYANSNDECTEVIGENKGYSLRPANEGMVFYPQLPHAAIGCQDDIVVPYKKLLPFLTPVGRVEVEAFTGAASK